MHIRCETEYPSGDTIHPSSFAVQFSMPFLGRSAQLLLFKLKVMKRKTPANLQYFVAIMIALVFISCRKERPCKPAPEPGPAMKYMNLNNREIKANTAAFNIDVNQDGRPDLVFTTLLVGDNLNQIDKLQFLVGSNIDVNLPVNINEDIPVMKKGDAILPTNFNGYEWFELSSIVLIQKIISLTQPPFWRGRWLEAVHNYVPFQMKENDKRYNGWVDISVDIPGEKIIVHKLAISTEANRVVKAGE
jgi:hypothetical protein